MGIKVIRDFQQDDDVVIRLEFEGAIDLTDNSFTVKFSSNLNSAAEYEHTFDADTNNHPNDDITAGVINLVVHTENLLTPNNYLYSITRVDSGGYASTIARTGLNSVDSVECKKKL